MAKVGTSTREQRAVEGWARRQTHVAESIGPPGLSRVPARGDLAYPDLGMRGGELAPRGDHTMGHLRPLVEILGCEEGADRCMVGALGHVIVICEHIELGAHGRQEGAHIRLLSVEIVTYELRTPRRRRPVPLQKGSKVEVIHRAHFWRNFGELIAELEPIYGHALCGAEVEKGVDVGHCEARDTPRRSTLCIEPRHSEYHEYDRTEYS